MTISHAGSHPLAVLGMYDLPEIRGATDRLWTAIYDRLKVAGVPAPQSLSRDCDMSAVWRDPAMVVGQTCGWPYVSQLRGEVELLGVPDYGIESCKPGWYNSVLISGGAITSDELPTLIAPGVRPDCIIAYNNKGSQSGYRVLRDVFGDTLEDRIDSNGLETGSHRETIRQVAAGNAHLGAVDAVTWRYTAPHEPATQSVKVIGTTEPKPGLPFITSAANRADADKISKCVRAAIDDLAAADREQLGINGLISVADADYEVLYE